MSTFRQYHFIYYNWLTSHYNMDQNCYCNFNRSFNHNFIHNSNRNSNHNSNCNFDHNFDHNFNCNFNRNSSRNSNRNFIHYYIDHYNYIDYLNCIHHCNYFDHITNCYFSLRFTSFNRNFGFTGIDILSYSPISIALNFNSSSIHLFLTL